MKKITLSLLSAALMGIVVNGTISAQQTQNIPQLVGSQIAVPSQSINLQAQRQNQPQIQSWCATDEITDVYIQQQMQQDPDYQNKINKMNNNIQQWLQVNSMGAKVLRTIPVVVHVIYNTPQQNVSDAAIFDMINTINEDFRRQNADTSNTRAVFLPVAADAEIEFCLASKDPFGVATNGITRTSTSETNFDPDTETNKMKDDATNGKTGWDAYKYLNIWVCNITNGTGFGVVGYAYLPTPGMHGSSIDGFVIDYNRVGGSGRTATHEIGHYMGLRHTWGNNPPSCGNDDGFADTPNSSDKNFGCDFSANTCGTPNGDQVENYMSYANCQNMYTIDQANYMNSILSGVRSSLLSSDGCEPTAPPVADFIANITTVQAGGYVWFTDLSTGVPDTRDWNFGGGGTPNTTAVRNPVIQFNTIGTYDVTLTVTNSLGSDTETKTLYINVIAPTGCDTINWSFLTDTPLYVYSCLPNPGCGYIVGTNQYDDLSKAQLFTVAEYAPNTHVTGGLFYFAYAYKDPGSSATVDINVWDSDGGGGSPGTILGTVTMDLADIVSDVQGNFYTQVLFNPPVQVTSDFYFGFSMVNFDPWGGPTRDTLVLVQTENGTSAGSLPWEEWSNNTWDPFTGWWNFTSNTLFASPYMTTLPPTANFTADTTVGCDGLTVTFNSASSTNANEYYWDIDGDGFYDWWTIDTTLTITYDTTGTFDIKLLVVGPCTGLHDTTFINYITINPSPTLVTTTVDASCGACDGSATVTPSGGTGPYTYLWTDSIPQTDSTATGLCPGSYQVQVTDANGCSNVSGASVTDGAGLSINVITTPDTCGNSVGTATVTVSGGTPGYTYQWDDPLLQTTAIADSLAAGTYNVTVTDTNGCSVTTDFFSAAVVSNVIDTITIAFSSTNVNCNGGNDGDATASPIGGTGPYTYSWNTSPSQSTAIATGLTAGTYTVIVADKNTCTTTDSITLADPPLLTVAFTGILDASCNGICDGAATVTPSGGTAPYTFSWGGGTNLCAATYPETITDNNGCTVLDTVIINDPPVLIASEDIPSHIDVSCNGGSDGQAGANASGGTSPYTFSWNTVPPQPGPIATGLSAGVYIVTLTDNNSCITTTNVTITEPAPVIASVTISGNDTICAGDNVTFTASPTNGGTPTYQWQVNGGNVGANSTTYSTTTLNNGDVVTCIMTSSLSCVTGSPDTSNTITMTVNAAPATPGSITGPGTPCIGSTQTYSISSVTGATSYTWTVPAGWAINSGQGTTSINVSVGSGSGNVCVDASNTCGTSAANCMVITVNTVPATPGVISGSGTPCVGSTQTYSISPVAGATSYTWTVPAGWTISGSPTTSMTVTVGSSSGNVCVRACNGCGCSSFSCMVITVNAAPAAPGAITGTVSVCEGQAGEAYSISAVAGATSYTWTVPTGATITAGQGTASITVTFGTASGNVCVTADNICGASPASCTAVTVDPIVTVSVAIAASVNPICIGDNVTFTATPTNGGTPTYQWQVNGGNVGTNSATYSTTILNDGDVVICIMTSSLSCVTGSPDTSNTITMTVSSSLSASVTISGNDTICAGDNVTYTATPTNGGTPTYQWQVNGSNVGTNSTTYSTSALNNGDVVTCIMTSSLSCATGSPVTSNAITITVSASLTASVTIAASADSICTGDNVTFNATSTNGGAPVYQWQVNGGNVGTNSTIYSTTTLINGDMITCIMTSSLSCATGSPATSNVVTITVNSLPLINTSSMVIDSSNCGNSDGSITDISASGGQGIFTSEWVNSSNTVMGSTFDLTNIPADSYTLTVTDANGCMATLNVNMSSCVPTGIEELSLANSIQLYPNPTSGRVMLKFALEKPTDIKVTVYNIIGKIVSVAEWKNVTSGIYRINLSEKATPNGWPPVKVANGIYYLNIQTDNEIIVKKVSVVR